MAQGGGQAGGMGGSPTGASTGGTGRLLEPGDQGDAFEDQLGLVGEQER